MPNRLIEKITDYLKIIGLYKLKDNYQDQSTNDDYYSVMDNLTNSNPDDLIQYEPLPQIYLDNLNNIDDSNKEKMLQELADRNGF